MLERINYVMENLEVFKATKGYEGERCKVVFYEGICIKVYKSEGEAIKEYYKLNCLDFSNHIPKIYFRKGNTIVMEKIEGVTLNKLNETKILEVFDEQLSLMFEECIELNYKPLLSANSIMLNEKGELKIVDLGLFERISKCDFMEVYIESVDYIHEELHLGE